MARKTRKYSKKASTSVERAMKKRKAGTLKSGRSGRKVKSRKQAIAIGLSEARAAGSKVPKKRKGKGGGAIISFVMPGLAPGIHVFSAERKKDVDGRDIGERK